MHVAETRHVTPPLMHAWLPDTRPFLDKYKWWTATSTSTYQSNPNLLDGSRPLHPYLCLYGWIFPSFYLLIMKSILISVHMTWLVRWCHKKSRRICIDLDVSIIYKLRLHKFFENRSCSILQPVCDYTYNKFSLVHPPTIPLHMSYLLSLIEFIVVMLLLLDLISL